MLEAILIDDEPQAIKSLQWELQNFSKEIIVLKTFTDPQEAQRFLNKQHVDCVFLDIEMPEMDGFQFLEYFAERDFIAIITTAYDQFAIKAIRSNALDYLLKPIDSDDLHECIVRIRKEKEKKEFHGKLKKNLENLAINENQGDKKITISTDGKLIILKTDKILYCQSDGNYCTVFMENNEKIFLTKKLKYMEEKLHFPEFFRIHNSFLINLNKVKEYHKADEYVILTNNAKLPVSRQRKAYFLDNL
ncbi:MAG: response regulator transcription factor [Aequorivita sp.]|nr:response regulator transcription factor [Aequorivita sp.]MCB0454177.1 response regulator transcription factor [Aequorivita sp.]HPE83071.1 LytTR family DNA-binding domain-containing protein [Aequorivita sp.]